MDRSLGIPLWEEMNNTINIRCVTDMADAEFKLEKFFNSFWRKSKAWALRQVVYQSLNSGEIYGLYK